MLLAILLSHIHFINEAVAVQTQQGPVQGYTLSKMAEAELQQGPLSEKFSPEQQGLESWV